MKSACRLAPLKNLSLPPHSLKLNVGGHRGRCSAVNLNMGTLVGSYETVAQMLDEAASVPGTSGVLRTFDDFVEGVENFGRYIQPKMTCRQHIVAA
jgi:alkanesulfonate monooxygenase SsuD/methylene tetrahydromethanopterin reductase-like flavin-dependent oxidoreductase (luciferase family)